MNTKAAGDKNHGGSLRKKTKGKLTPRQIEQFGDTVFQRMLEHNPMAHRANAIFEGLWNTWSSGRKLSSATKGRERELVVEFFLKDVLPSACRIGTGDILDRQGRRSGQLDIVLERPNYYSIPAFQGGPRLYPVEGVLAVIEVKSNLRQQWGEVVETANKFRELERTGNREILGMLERLRDAMPQVSESLEDQWHDELGKLRQRAKAELNVSHSPVFVIGFEGWKTKEGLESNLKDSPVDMALVVESRLCAGKSTTGEVGTSKGLYALLGFLDRISYELDSQAPFVSTARNHGTNAILGGMVALAEACRQAEKSKDGT